MQGGGEGIHVGLENDTGLKNSDQLKPTKVVPPKRRRKRLTKIQADQCSKDEEQGEWVGNNNENSLNQRLAQLPRTSVEVLPRKRGRSRKTPAEGAKEAQRGEGSHGGQKYETSFGLSMASPRGISSPEIAFASESTYFTRTVKAYLDRCLASSAPLKSPVRNVITTAADKHDHPTATAHTSAAKSSSHHIKSQGLGFSATSLPSPNRHASTLPSETENLNTSVLRKLEDQSTVADHGLRDINDLSADLLAQNHGSGDVYQAEASDLEFVVDNYQPVEEANMPPNVTKRTKKETASKSKQSSACPSRSMSLNLTQMCSLMDDDIADFDEVASRFDEALVSVNGYRVKAEVAPILRDIFFRYGDIAKDSTFCAVKSRSCLLENVCGIYKKLEGANFMLITPMELNSLLEEVIDLETVKIELGWLHYRLDEILSAIKGFQESKREKRKNYSSY